MFSSREFREFVLLIIVGSLLMFFWYTLAVVFL
jgi:hypothetical protein